LAGFIGQWFYLKKTSKIGPMPIGCKALHQYQKLDIKKLEAGSNFTTELLRKKSNGCCFPKKQAGTKI